MGVSAFAALVSTGFQVAGLAAGASLALFGVQVSAFTYFAAMTVTYAVLGSISRELFAQPSLDSMNGINFNVRDPASTRKIVYGKCRVGGTIVYFNTSNADNEYLHLVIAVAGHEINAFKQVYFGQKKVWENGSYIVDGTTDWADYVRLKFHKGDQTTADSDLVAETAFTSSHKLLDTAYIYARLKYDTDVYTSGVPNISCVIEGKKVYDTRTSTTVYSNNPALIAYDFLRDTKYGLGESASNIDTASITAAANVCDENIVIDGQSNTQKNYTCDGMLDSGSTVKANLENILSSMIGSISFANGKFYLSAYDDIAVHSDAIDVDMITSPISVSTRRSKTTLFNTVKGKFISEENNYIVADYPTQEAASYVTEDGESLVLDLVLPMTTNSAMAQRIARLTMKKSRQQMSINLQLNLKGLKYKVGDNISVNYDRFSWSNKRFEITKLQVMPDPERGLVVDIEAVENSSSAYTWSYQDLNTFEVATDDASFDGTTVIAPTNLRVVSIGDPQDDKFALRAVWDGVEQADGASPYEPYLSHYEVRVTDASASTDDHQYYETGETSQDVIIHTNYNRYFSIQPSTVTVKAVNTYGVKSAGIYISGIDKTDYFPDFVENSNPIVKATYADPTSDQLSELAAAQGLPVTNGSDLIYIQVDASGNPINVQEYIFETATLTATQTADSNPLVTNDGFDNPIKNHDFLTSGDWTITSGWTISTVMDGYLTHSNVQQGDFAYQMFSDTPQKRTLTIDINSITATAATPIFIRIYAAQGWTPITSANFTTTGIHTIDYDSPGDTVVMVGGNATQNVAIDRISLGQPKPDAFNKYIFTVNTLAEVTWSFTKTEKVNLPHVGATEVETGFNGTNLRNPEGHPYVEMSLTRSGSNTGHSEQRVTVEAEWEETEDVDGTPTTIIKTATRSIIMQARVE